MFLDDGRRTSIGADVSQKTLGKFGAVDSVHIPLNDEGRARGFAFVQYERQAVCSSEDS